MSIEIHTCQCPHCQQKDEHPDQLHHHQTNLLISHLNEQHRRWYAALESFKLGRGGIELMSQITGLDHKTIRRGRQELEAEMEGRPMERIRQEGGGRRMVEKKTLKLSDS